MHATPQELDYGFVASLAGPVALLVATVLWIGTGYRAVAFLAQQGHDLRRWATLSMALGPILAAWALSIGKRWSDPVEVIEVASGSRGPGDLLIVVAVLGEPEGVAAADPLLVTLADRVGEVVLVRPIGSRTDDESRIATEASAARALSQAALFVSGLEARLLLAVGNGPSAIDRFAVEHRPDVFIVVGAGGGHPAHAG